MTLIFFFGGGYCTKKLSLQIYIYIVIPIKKTCFFYFILVPNITSCGYQTVRYRTSHCPKMNTYPVGNIFLPLGTLFAFLFATLLMIEHEKEYSTCNLPLGADDGRGAE